MFAFPIPHHSTDSDALPLRLLSCFLRCTYGWRLTKVPKSDQGAVQARRPPLPHLLEDGASFHFEVTWRSQGVVSTGCLCDVIDHGKIVEVLKVAEES